MKGRYEIRSSEGGLFALEQVGDKRWTVEFEDRGLSAKLPGVWLNEGWGQYLDHYFAEMAVQWRGWTGDLTWQSDELEVRMSATHNRAGTVIVQVQLAELEGGPREWRAHGQLHLDVGALETISNDLRELLSSDQLAPDPS